MENRSFLFQIFAVLATALAIIAGLIAGGKVDDRWFDLYGGAAALLAALPFLQFLLWRGLARRDRSRWLSLLVTAPLGIVALAQIGFWAAFFSDPAMAVNLGVVRGALWDTIGPFAGWIMAVYAALSAWVISRDFR
ncbi:MAG: hypothetical protein H7X92_06440 [Chitinophagales bacterium]|nr:hypothetical protein [Hyphomicrobiales bacterium]